MVGNLAMLQPSEQSISKCMFHEIHKKKLDNTLLKNLPQERIMKYSFICAGCFREVAYLQ